MEPWYVRYAPRRVSEIAGNPQARKTLDDWFGLAGQGRASKPLLVVGPPGVGKTVSIKLYAEANGVRLSEYPDTGGDVVFVESGESLRRREAASLLSSGRLVVVELRTLPSWTREVDAVWARFYRLKASDLREVLRRLVKVPEVREALARFCREDGDEERFETCVDTVIGEAVEHARGDARAAITFLQARVVYNRAPPPSHGTVLSTFEAVWRIVDADTPGEVLQALDEAPVPAEEVVDWLAANAERWLPEKHERAAALRFLVEAVRTYQEARRLGAGMLYPVASRLVVGAVAARETARVKIGRPRAPTVPPPVEEEEEAEAPGVEAPAPPSGEEATIEEYLDKLLSTL